MHILFVSESYPPTSGGVATSTRRIASSLTKLGVQVDVVCFDNCRKFDDNIMSVQDYCDIQIDESIRIFNLGPFFIKRSDINADEIAEKKKAVLRRRLYNQLLQLNNEYGPYDLILAFYLYNPGFLSLFLSRELGIPLITGVRGNDIGTNIFDLNRFAVTQWVVDGSSRIICVNDHLKKMLNLFAPHASKKVSVIHNSVDISVYERPKQKDRVSLIHKFGWNESDTILVFNGNLREKKGAQILIEAVNNCGENNIRLLLIGKQPNKEEIGALFNTWNSLCSNNIAACTNHLERNEIPQLLNACDIVLMPSIEDGLPNGLLEGMAAKNSPIVTDIFSDIIIDNMNGLVVPKNDVQSLKNAIIHLSKNKNLAKQLGLEARKTVEHWTPEQEAKKYLEVFNEVIG